MPNSIPNQSCMVNLQGHLESKPTISTPNHNQVANAHLICGEDRISVAAWSSEKRPDWARAFAATAPGSLIRVSGFLSEQAGRDDRWFWNVRIQRWNTAQSGSFARFFCVGELLDVPIDEEGVPWLLLSVEGKTEPEQFRVRLGPALAQLREEGGLIVGEVYRVKGAIYARMRHDDYGAPAGYLHALYGHLLESWTDGDFKLIGRERGV